MTPFYFGKEKRGRRRKFVSNHQEEDIDALPTPP
jgi:hypothetical protein